MVILPTPQPSFHLHSSISAPLLLSWQIKRVWLNGKIMPLLKKQLAPPTCSSSVFCRICHHVFSVSFCFPAPLPIFIALTPISYLSRLTAFVLKSFAQSRGFIFIDPEELRAAKSWLIKHQRDDGSFPAMGRILNKDLQVGLLFGGCNHGPNYTNYLHYMDWDTGTGLFLLHCYRRDSQITQIIFAGWKLKA